MTRMEEGGRGQGSTCIAAAGRIKGRALLWLLGDRALTHTGEGFTIIRIHHVEDPLAREGAPTRGGGGGLLKHIELREGTSTGGGGSPLLRSLGMSRAPG